MYNMQGTHSEICESKNAVFSLFGPPCMT